MERTIKGLQVFSSASLTGIDSMYAARVGVCSQGGETHYFQVGEAETELHAEQLAAEYILLMKELPADWLDQCLASPNPE